MFKFFNTERYARISSGSGDTRGMSTITSEDKCKAAAKNLGLVDTSPSRFRSPEIPHGCVYASNDWLGWKSPIGAPSVSKTCGTRLVSKTCGTCTYDCICTIQGIKYVTFMVRLCHILTLYNIYLGVISNNCFVSFIFFL